MTLILFISSSSVIVNRKDQQIRMMQKQRPNMIDNFEAQKVFPNPNYLIPHFIIHIFRKYMQNMDYIPSLQ
jgi:hypothetical protein